MALRARYGFDGERQNNIIIHGLNHNTSPGARAETIRRASHRSSSNMSSQRQTRHFTNARATNFYYSFVFLSQERRQAIEAVYAFARRSDDAADQCISPEEGESELSRCRQDLDRCYNASAEHPDESLSPELAALAEAVHRFDIPREHFEELFRGIEMDLHPAPYRTFEDLSLYCYRVASTIGLISIEIFGYQNPRTRRYAANLGMALQLVNILRDVESDARRGRVYLPGEDLERFGVRPESLLEGKPSGRFLELMKFESERARRYFAQARQALPPEDRRSLIAAEIMGALYWRLLARIERRQYKVFGERIRLPQPLKFWIALTVYLGAEWQ